MARKNVKVVIPSNPDDTLDLADDIIKEHMAAGATSPLNGLDMPVFIAKVAAAKVKNGEQKELYRAAEKATEERDNLLGRKKDQNVTTEGTILNIITRSRDVLLGLHKGNEQQLGQWGFEVNQTVSARPKNSSGGGETPTPTPTPTDLTNGTV